MYELYLCDFFFSNQIRYHSPETQPLSPLISSPLKMTCLPLSVSLLSPFSFKLRNSPTQNIVFSSISARSLQVFQEFRFNPTVGMITSDSCRLWTSAVQNQEDKLLPAESKVEPGLYYLLYIPTSVFSSIENTVFDVFLY